MARHVTFTSPAAREGRRGLRGDGAGGGVRGLAVQDPVLVEGHPHQNEHDELGLGGPGRDAGGQGRKRVRRRRCGDSRERSPPDVGRAPGERARQRSLSVGGRRWRGQPDEVAAAVAARLGGVGRWQAYPSPVSLP